MYRSIATKAVLVLLIVAGGNARAAKHGPRLNGRYTATAYSVTGVTASGIYTNRHVVAADPSILPIGTIIKIRHAGKYRGEYVVADTGRKIVGRRLDIYMPSTRACMNFGKRIVKVKVIKLGNGTHEDTKIAAHQVRENVAKDLRKGVVGNAATEVDWATHDGPAKAAALQSQPTSPSENSAENATPEKPRD